MSVWRNDWNFDLRLVKTCRLRSEHLKVIPKGFPQPSKTADATRPTLSEAEGTAEQDFSIQKCPTRSRFPRMGYGETQILFNRFTGTKLRVKDRSPGRRKLHKATVYRKGLAVHVINRISIHWHTHTHTHTTEGQRAQLAISRPRLRAHTLNKAAAAATMVTAPAASAWVCFAWTGTFMPAACIQQGMAWHVKNLVRTQPLCSSKCMEMSSNYATYLQG